MATETFTARRLDSSEITYYLSKPYGKNKFGIVLVLQGSKCETVYSSIPATQDLIIKNSFARLDIEKYGINKNSTSCPKVYLDNNSIDSRINDVLKVLYHLRKEPRWNHDLYIVGASEGATLAPILATYIPETKKIVLLGSGGGMTMKEDFQLLEKSRLAREAKNTEEIKKEILIIENQMNEMINNPLSTKTWAGGTNTYKWWASILNVRPLEYMLDLDIPILLMHGDRDTSSSIETSRLSDNQFKLKEKKNLSYKEYKGYDHNWNNEKGENKTKDILIDLVSWLRQK